MMKAFMAAAALVTVSGCASFEDRMGVNTPTFVTTLAPGAGVASTGSGDGIATLDTKTNVLGYTINYTINYKGLSGPPTMAHIHGPAEPGSNAGVVVPLTIANATQLAGTVTLTEAQVADLYAGRYYVNIHTDANKGGEIRGQLTPFKFAN